MKDLLRTMLRLMKLIFSIKAYVPGLEGAEAIMEKRS